MPHSFRGFYESPATGAIFQQEYLVRHGKLGIIDKKRRTVPLNFSNWERDDLEEGFILFASLTETFKKNGGHKPSVEILKKIAQLCYASMDAQAGLGLA
jgi:hypothetical protein